MLKDLGWLKKVKIWDGTNVAGVLGDRLKVVSPPPTIPDGASQVLIVEDDNVSGTVDTIHVIPNGKTLHITRFSGGAEFSVDGSKITLYRDPNGDGTNMTIISAGFVNGGNFLADLIEQIEGDGIKAIRLRRKNLTGGVANIFARVEGYEI